MNIRDTKKVVEKSISKHLTPILWGKAGIGKSQIIRQLGEELAEKENLTFTTNPKEFDKEHFGIVDLRLGQMEVGDLIGMPNIDTEKNLTEWASPSWFPLDPNSKGIIFLDELNRARLDVLQAIFQLVWDRKIHTHNLPKGWGIVVACNPSGSEYFVNELDQALLDRFVHIKVSPEVKEWVSWAKNTEKISLGVTDFIEKYPEMLGKDSGNISVFEELKPSPRSWEVLSIMLEGLDEKLWYEVAIGILGNECAVPFITSLKKNLKKPVRATDVLNEYSKWAKTIKEYAKKENSRFDLLKITCDDIERELKNTYIEKDISTKQIENLVQFLKDLPNDLSFATIKTLVNSEQMGTNKFNEMLGEYDDLYTKLEKVADLDE